MTVKLKVVPGEGYGVIISMNLPAELVAGDWITGSIRIGNTGQADKMALVIITQWNGNAYGIVLDLAWGQDAEIIIDAGIIVMPSQDAVMKIYACHAEVGGEFVIDGVEFKIDDTRTH